jgi:heat shock protein HslJ
MKTSRLTKGLRRVACLAVMLSAFVVVSIEAGNAADIRFPFDRELLLDTAPMRPNKRVPGLTIAANGSVIIDLWCRSVPGRVDLDETTIAIVPDELPPAPPQMMSHGQCTPARMQADEDMLAALSQVTAWRREGSAVVLAGAKRMRFRPATN